MRRHRLPPPNTNPLWHVTVTTRDGEIVDHHTGEDEKECQAIATLARERSLGHRIHVRSPFGRTYSWA